MALAGYGTWVSRLAGVCQAPLADSAHLHLQCNRKQNWTCYNCRQTRIQHNGAVTSLLFEEMNLPVFA
jgi:hypothetical protein